MQTGYRPDRLARAWQLVKSGRVERLGGGQFRVAGNDEPEYFVDLSVDPPCYCADQNYRGGSTNHQCKHSLAGRLAMLEPALLQVIADTIERQMQQEQEREQAGVARRTSQRKAAHSIEANHD